MTCRICTKDFLVAVEEVFVFSRSVAARCPDCDGQMNADATIGERLYLTFAGATVVTGRKKSFQFTGGILRERVR